MEFKDPKTHRDPVWPVGGFAPGKYMGKCQDCGHRFHDMDKRAYQCLPCAIDSLILVRSDLLNKCRKAEEENRILRAAIKIINTEPTPDKENSA